MKIAVNARFLTQRVTGVQRYAREATKALIRLLGPQAVVLLAPGEASDDEFEGAQVIRAGRARIGYAWEQAVLPTEWGKTGADLLWSPGNIGPLAVAKQVVTIHDAAVWGMPQGLDPRLALFYRVMLPKLAWRCSAVITVSDFSRLELAKYLQVPPDTIHLASCGVSERFCPIDDDLAQRFRERYGLPEKYVLVLGSRSPNKNHSAAVNAWKRISHMQSATDWWLVIAGGRSVSLRSDGVDGDVSWTKRVRCLGYVDDEDLPQLYASAGLLVFPSLYEGFGLPPLEAMACGTPVVVSKSASLPEVVGDAGVYVNPCDIEDIARGIYGVLASEELREELRERGTKRARLFTWDKCAREILEVFEKVVEAGRGATKP